MTEQSTSPDKLVHRTAVWENEGCTYQIHYLNVVSFLFLDLLPLLFVLYIKEDSPSTPFPFPLHPVFSSYLLGLPLLPKPFGTTLWHPCHTQLLRNTLQTAYPYTVSMEDLCKLKITININRHQNCQLYHRITCQKPPYIDMMQPSLNPSYNLSVQPLYIHHIFI